MLDMQKARSVDAVAMLVLMLVLSVHKLGGYEADQIMAVIFCQDWWIAGQKCGCFVVLGLVTSLGR